MARIAAIQMTSNDSVAENLKTVERLVKESVKQKANCVVLPENVAFIGQQDTDKLAIAEQPGEGPIQACLAGLAKAYDIWVVGGTIPIVSEQKDKVYAASWAWDNSGTVVARYNKIHLFDVEVKPGESYLESKTLFPGNEIVNVATPFGNLGLSVCYDVRFPELYRALQKKGAEILVVPSAFTAVTGAAHWESLLRARAIENLCYVVAPNQTGVHPHGRATYGHSLIVDPWGKIVASLPAGEGVIVADIDLQYLADIRTRFPALNHTKVI